MPFQDEYASYGPLRRVAASARIHELFQQYTIQQAEVSAPLPALVDASSLPDDGWLPDYIIALDGSYVPVPLRNGYPGAEMACVTVAAAILDMARIRGLDEHRPVDPVLFRQAHEADAIDCAIPGSNVVITGEGSAQASLRRVLHDVLAQEQMSNGKEFLLETYEALLNLKPVSGQNQKCPYDDCHHPDREYTRGIGKYVCACALARPLYSTDALRFVEGMNEGGSNGAMFAEIMQVLERLWIIHSYVPFYRMGGVAFLDGSPS